MTPPLEGLLLPNLDTVGPSSHLVRERRIFESLRICLEFTKHLKIVRWAQTTELARDLGQTIFVCRYLPASARRWQAGLPTNKKIFSVSFVSPWWKFYFGQV